MSFLPWEEMTQNSSPAAHSVEFMFSSIFIWNRGTEDKLFSHLTLMTAAPPKHL